MNNTLNLKIVQNIKNVLGDLSQPIPLHEPFFLGNEKKYLENCIDSRYVSYIGEYVKKFEESLCEHTHAKAAIAVVSGTAALHLALKVIGVDYQDEVLLPSLTFVATANAVTYCGATPHFVEVDEETLGVNPEKLENYLSEIIDHQSSQCINKLTGKKIKALIVVHVFGHPVDLDPVNKVCERYGIDLIEDSAQALGSVYKNRPVGNFGRIACLSFNGNKIITTGGGGALLFQDIELADRAKHLSTTARVADNQFFYHDQIGFNYRMPNINAAIGCAQLETLRKKIDQKRQLANRYLDQFQSVEGVKIFREPHYAKSNYWLNTMILNNPRLDNVTDLLSVLNKHNILARPAWSLMHHLPMYVDNPKMDLVVSEKLFNSIINLPSTAELIERV
jgi:perosamine synthetase